MWNTRLRLFYTQLILNGQLSGPVLNTLINKYKESQRSIQSIGGLREQRATQKWFSWFIIEKLSLLRPLRVVATQGTHHLDQSPLRPLTTQATLSQIVANRREQLCDSCHTLNVKIVTKIAILCSPNNVDQRDRSLSSVSVDMTTKVASVYASLIDVIGFDVQHYCR